MNCRRVRRLLPAFVGEDLAGPISSRLREHLRDCHPCAREFAAGREARLALRENLRIPEPPSDLWQRIESKILPRSGPARPLRHRLPFRRVAAAGILLAATLAGSFAYFGPWRRPAPPLPGAAGGPSVFLGGEGRIDETEYPGYLRRVDGDAREFFTFPVGDTIPVSHPAGGNAFPAWPPPTQGRPANLRTIRRDF